MNSYMSNRERSTLTTQALNGSGFFRVDPKDPESATVNVQTVGRQWAFGRWDYLVTPESGTGTFWKRGSQITWTHGPVDAVTRHLVSEASPKEQ